VHRANSSDRAELDALTGEGIARTLTWIADQLEAPEPQISREGIVELLRLLAAIYKREGDTHERGE
jgi:hypothetical protein